MKNWPRKGCVGAWSAITTPPREILFLTRPEVAQKALAFYHRENPLDERELALLYPFLLWPQDFWQVGLQFFAERLPWPAERFWATLSRRTADREEREGFLAWFKKEYWRPKKPSFFLSLRNYRKPDPREFPAIITRGILGQGGSP